MTAERTIQAKIERLVARIVEEVHPQRIVMFGSAARGDMTMKSDLDLLVIMPEGTHRRNTAQLLYQQLKGIEIPFDLVVATPEDLRRHGSNPGLIYDNALREGKDLYAA